MLTLRISTIFRGEGKLNTNGSRYTMKMVRNGSKVTGEFYRADGEAVAECPFSPPLRNLS